MDEWFVCVPGGDPVGPVSLSLLILGIRSGKVPDDALVCRVGEKTWRGVMEEPALSAALPGPEAFRGAERDARYGTKTLLGQGGMGEVFLCGDEWIGREVAMKVARGGKDVAAHLRARFVREALVQGQLEHPSIVPVYDLGTRADGATYFTMKRVRGLTLAAIIDGLRRGDAAITKAYSRRRLLAAMGSVCLAVSFAHSRGVVHRDLKPENVMLGDFGEVYVLDWGVAKVLEDSWAGRGAITVGAPVGRTQLGALIGTPGYASPEQAEGDVAVGAASDVYALGAILFELLAQRPLHVGRTTEELVASTVLCGGGPPSERAPELGISPELDAICVRATARDHKKRFAGAREMQEALERYLDGERDREQRRELAKRHADSARAAFVVANEPGPDRELERARGIRELGAALALEPTNEDALVLLMQALLDAPTDLPPEAAAALAEENRRDRVRGARDGVMVYALMGVSAPILLTMHMRRPLLFVALVFMTVATQGYFAWMWRTGNAQRRYMRFAVPMSFALVALTSSVFGPFIIAPSIAVVTLTAFLVNLRADRSVRRLILASALASIFGPWLLEVLGILPNSYSVKDGVIRVASALVDIEPGAAMLLLALASATALVAAVLSVGRAVDALVASERRNFAQAYRLKQLLPAGPAPDGPGE